MKVYFSDFFFYKTKPYIKKRGIYLNFSRLVSWSCWLPCLRWGFQTAEPLEGVLVICASGCLEKETRRFQIATNNSLLTMLTQGIGMFPVCWLNIHLLKWNAFTKLYGDLGVTVTRGRLKPPLAWTSTWKHFHFHLLWLNDAHGKTYLLFCLLLYRVRS